MIDKFLNKIINSDVLEGLRSIPDNSIDLTITSPPYNKRNKAYGWLVSKQKYSHYDDYLPEEEYQKWQIEVLNELWRVTKPGGSLFYNHKQRWDKGNLLHPFMWLCNSIWHIKQEIVWDRGLAANMRGWRYWQVDERIYWMYKPINNGLIGKELEAKHAKFSSIWRIKPAPRSEDHPAPFPLEIPTRIIHSFLNDENAVVLDPYCGTGTTLVAAKLLGFNYIGIDISPDYESYAELRLSSSESEREVVQKEIDKHFVEFSFADRKSKGTTKWPFAPKSKDKILDAL